MSEVRIAAADKLMFERFHKDIQWLKSQAAKSIIPQRKQWLTYDEAKEILPMSKRWFAEQRNGENATLVKNVDWKYQGKETVYNIDAIERLKKNIQK